MLVFILTLFGWLTLYAWAGLVIIASALRARWREAANRVGAGTLLGVGMCFFGFSGFLIALAGRQDYLTIQAVILLLLPMLGITQHKSQAAAEARLAGDGATTTSEKVNWSHVAVPVAVTLLAARCLQVFYFSVRWPLHGWDALAIWSLKAKILFVEPLSTTTYFSDLTKSYSHLDYPLLLPLLELQIFRVHGGVDDALAPALFPIVYLVLILGFYEIARGFTTRTQALFFSVLLAMTSALSDLATTGQADVLFATFVLLSVGNFLLWHKTSASFRLYLGVLFGSAALFTKNEGLAAFLLAYVLALAAQLLRRPSLPWLKAQATHIAGSLLLCAALSGPWLIFRSSIPKVHENYGDRLSLASLIAGLPRLSMVWSYFESQALAWQSWQLLWWLPLFALALHPRGVFTGHRLQLLVYLAGMVVVYTAAYLVTPWVLEDLLRYSMDRLLAHLAPLVVLLVAMVAGDLAVGQEPES